MGSKKTVIGIFEKDMSSKLTLFLLWFSAISFGQNSPAYHEIHIPNWTDYVQRYLDGDRLRMDTVHETADLLTNYWMSEWEGIPLAKRKKAVVRHVKHLTEELDYQEKKEQAVDLQTKELLFELEYLKRSYVEKSWADQHNDVTRKDKIAMLIATFQSHRKMIYPIIDYHLNISDSTYFWTPNTEVSYKRFGTLADRKKIDTDAQMIVLFDGLSHDGSAPKIKGMDTDLDNEWVVKWGDEVHTDVVGSRLFAALGFDVDHPYFYGNNELFLVLDSTRGVGTWEALQDSIQRIYSVDLTPFFSREMMVDEALIAQNEKFEPYIGRQVVTFRECAIEARPDRVKRLGSFLPDDLMNEANPTLRGALLAHVWIDNWDVREQNTLLTTVHDGNHHYHVSAVFSDLGTSLGVQLSPISGDFKVGLVNELGWDAAKRGKKKVRLKGRINAWSRPYEITRYEDLEWMATQIATIDSLSLRKILKKSGWPAAVQELYFHKLASRRASILHAFQIEDPHPIEFNRRLNFTDASHEIKKGKLKAIASEHPEHLIGRKGRMRNYGN